MAYSLIQLPLCKSCDYYYWMLTLILLQVLGQLGVHRRTDLSAVINNLRVGAENSAAARGRIVDADYAMETANLSRAQVLQQAGTAMVAQANQAPQGVLALLR
jgi:flagellin-like hook-associated protein FlgL